MQGIYVNQLLLASIVLTERSLQLVFVILQKLHAREIVDMELIDLNAVLLEVVTS
jgi:hypothetical protein